MVTSCGDDETPTPTPTSADTSTPTPTPTPTSTAPIAFSVTQDFAASSANTNAIVGFFTPDGSTSEVFSSAARVNGTAVIELDTTPDTASFGFPDIATLLVFAAADFVSVSATERRYARGDEALTLFLPATHIMRVTYDLDDQAFTRDNVAGTLRSRRSSLFFNPVTTTDDITAALTYTGTAEAFGGAPGVTPSGILTVTATNLVVTPGATATAADTVTITIEIFETVNNVSTRVATLVMTDDVTTNGTFFGDIDDNTFGLDGEFAGSLAGPNREEAFLVFSVTDDDPADADNRRFVGSWIGAR
ncbi:hypothetical protein [Erythrobacter sp. EC-HK427]|uniref:hypothetical protein n=1 Tax=Erythrobacter sp. EC-HK427 TaxID=2038396 RepID=UPI00125EB317|nr:hypothetical protein [Erythrobacter sp. EC-HK427]